MKRKRTRGGWALAALAGWLAAALACAEARPVPSSTLEAAGLDAALPPGSSPDAGSLEAPLPQAAEPDAGGLADAAAVPPVEWDLIDSGLDEKGQVQLCDAASRFAPLATVLAKPVAGPVAVRGRAWLPISFPCTAGFPEACFASPVLAPSRPKEQERKQIVLDGLLAPNVTLACTGSRQALRCPIPLEGREYGVTGVLRVSGDGDERLQELAVEKLCRFPSGGGR